MLTTLTFEAAKSKERPYKLADNGGLLLLVQPNGSKLWRYKFRVNGTEGLQALCAFPQVSLVDARGGASHEVPRAIYTRIANNP